MEDSDEDFVVAKNRCAACGEVNHPGKFCASGVRNKMRRVPKTVREAVLSKPTGASAPVASGKRKERTLEDD
eukprot:5585342-Prymnesium_polylepis.1